MLMEHIIEPDFLLKLSENKRNCTDFVREFSRQSPRVISEFPKYSKFKSLVMRALPDDGDEIRRVRLESLLGFIAENGRVRRSTAYIGDKSLFENIKESIKTFSADYLVLESFKDCETADVKVITINDFTEGIPSIPNQALVNKNVDDMCRAVESFLRLSKQITFVDPYFSVRPEMWKPMVRFIELSQQSSPTIEKHIRILFNGNIIKNGQNTSPCHKFILDKFLTEHPESLSSLNSIEVTAIKEKVSGEKIHNRYMISELGALMWGIGHNEEKSEVSDDLTLLNDELYNHRYSQYVEMTAFDVCSSTKKTF
jgi:hypothetical protein